MNSNFTTFHTYYYIDGSSHYVHTHSLALHRLDGPAVEYTNGHKEYWVEGKLHRLDGPAVEYRHTKKYKKYYYVNGVNVTDKVKSIKKEDITKYLRMLSL